MSSITKLLLGAVAAVTLATSAFAAEPAKTMRTDKGDALVDVTGMTLYVFDKDTAGKSACSGPCAVNWPPLMAKPEDVAVGEWTIIMRDDGTKQWAYKNKPLYKWSKDMKSGEATGDGVNGVWHIAKP